MRTHKIIFQIITFVWLAGCTTISGLFTTPTPTLEPSEYWPEEDWRASTPEEQGMNANTLAALLEYIQEHTEFDFDSILVVRNGTIVLEVYYYPFTATDKHGIYSAGKSVTATVVGIAIDQGYIDGVDQPVLSFFPGYTFENYEDRKAEITIEHLLTMTSGLAYGTETSNLNRPTTNPYQRMWASDDWLQCMLDLPMEANPGDHYNYSTGAVHILMAVVNESIAGDSASFVDENLFEPLGITDYIWTTAPDGTPEGGGSIYLTPRDMARFGYLYLRNGVWEGEQIVPVQWVEAATSAHVDPDSREYKGYGYLWWVDDDHHYYTAHGASGQRIFVAPDQDLVFVTTAHNWGISNRTERLFEDFILGAIESADLLPSNPEGLIRLEQAIEVAQQIPEPEPVAPMPEIAYQISGKRYSLDENMWGWQQFSVDFKEEVDFATLTLYLDDKTIQIPVGLDHVFHVTDIEAPGYWWNVKLVEGPVAARGNWIDEKTFAFELVIYHHRVHSSNISMTFEDGKVIMNTVKRSMADIPSIQGSLQE